MTKLFCDFGAQSALTRRDGPERLSGENGEDRQSGRKLRQPHCPLHFSQYKNAMPKRCQRVRRKIGFIETMDCLPVSKLPEGPEWAYESLCADQHEILCCVAVYVVLDSLTSFSVGSAAFLGQHNRLVA